MAPESDADKPTFADLFDEFHDPVLYWFLRRGLRREVAEELTQDTFVYVFRGLEKFRGDSSPKTWVFRIARNRFKNHLRSRSTGKRDGIEVRMSINGRLGEPDDSSGGIQVPDSSAPNPEDELVAKQESEALHGARGSLPPKMCQAVELRLAGLKYREIAEIMGLSIETVKSHLHQARLRLKGLLNEAPDLDREQP